MNLKDNLPLASDVLQSKVIDFLRFPMIMGIVIVHAFLEDIQGVDVPLEGIPVYRTLSFFISKIVGQIAVPVFFFISGYLFFYRTSFSAATYKNKLRSRIRTLLIPYLFWNLFILACHWIVYLFIPVKLTSGAYKLINDYTWLDYLKAFWNINDIAPVNGVLWFIRDLMIMAVCSPLVYGAIRYFRGYILIVLGGLWLMKYDMDIPRLSSVFFFSLGAWFSINKRNFVADFRPFLLVGVLLYSLIALAGLIGRDTFLFPYIYNVSVFAGLVASTAIVAHYVNKGSWQTVPFLTGSYFFIYVFHQLPMNAVVRFYYRIAPPQTDWQFVLIYILAPLLVVAADLFVYALLRKYFPRFAIFITGGRIDGASGGLRK